MTSVKCSEQDLSVYLNLRPQVIKKIKDFLDNNKSYHCCHGDVHVAIDKMEEKNFTRWARLYASRGDPIKKALEQAEWGVMDRLG